MSPSLPWSGSIPGQGTEIPASHVEQPKSKQTKKVKQFFKKASCVLASLPAQPLLALRSCGSDSSVLCSDLPLNSPAAAGFYSFVLLGSSSTGPSSSSSPGPFPALPCFPCHSELGRRQLGIIALRKSALGIHSPSKSSAFCPFYLQ